MTGRLTGLGPVSTTTRGARQMLGELFDRAADAVELPGGSQIAAQMFAMPSKRPAKQLITAARAGAQVKALVDPLTDPKDQHRKALTSAGARFEPYGVADSDAVRAVRSSPLDPLSKRVRKGTSAKLHSKVYTARLGDEYAGVLTTSSLERGRETDLSVALRPDDAQVVHSLTLAAIDGDQAAVRDLSDEWAERGGLLNNPVAGVHTLTDAWFDGVANARRSVQYASKELSSPRAVDALADASRGGRDVQVAARRIPSRLRERLQDANVTITDMRDTDSFAHPLHGNLLLLDDETLLAGTAHGSGRALNLRADGTYAEPTIDSTKREDFASAESGFITDDPAIVDAGRHAMRQMLEPARD